MKAYYRKWSRANKDKVAAYHRDFLAKHSTYRSLEEYDELAKEQNGVCPICGKTNTLNRRLALLLSEQWLEQQDEAQCGRYYCAVCHLPPTAERILES